VAGWRLAGLPKGGSPRGYAATVRRDFAMLTLLARLGLRAGEVAALGACSAGENVSPIGTHLLRGLG